MDQQSQFNTTQRELREFYYQIRGQPWINGPGLPGMDVTNMPAEPLVFQTGTQSAGLELVDIYLWIFKCFMEGKELTRPLARLVYTNQNTAARTVFLCSRSLNELRNSLKNYRNHRPK